VRLQRVGQSQDAGSHLLVRDSTLAIAGDQRFAVGQYGAADRQELGGFISNLRLTWLSLERE